MKLQYAKKLHNRDEVEVKVDKDWINGYVVGDSTQSQDGKTYWFNIQTPNGFMSRVCHKDLR